MKNGQTTLYGLFLGLLVIVAVFSAVFIFYKEEVQYSQYGVPSRINTTYNNLTEQLDEINDTVTDIRESTLGMAEAKTGGVGGLIVTSIEGFSATAKLFKEGFTFGINIIVILLESIGLPIPGWAVAILVIVLTLIVITAILLAISGRVRF